MNITGTITEIMNVEQISDSFKKRSFVVKTNEDYPQEIIMEFTQDRVGILDKYKVGEQVNVSINLRGRRYEKDGNTRFFNSITAWKIDYSGEHADAIHGQNLENDLSQDEDEFPY